MLPRNRCINRAMTVRRSALPLTHLLRARLELRPFAHRKFARKPGSWFVAADLVRKPQHVKVTAANSRSVYCGQFDQVLAVMPAFVKHLSPSRTTLLLVRQKAHETNQHPRACELA